MPKTSSPGSPGVGGIFCRTTCPLATLAKRRICLKSERPDFRMEGEPSRRRSPNTSCGHPDQIGFPLNGQHVPVAAALAAVFAAEFQRQCPAVSASVRGIGSGSRLALGDFGVTRIRSVTYRSVFTDSLSNTGGQPQSPSRTGFTSPLCRAS